MSDGTTSEIHSPLDGLQDVEHILCSNISLKEINRSLAIQRLDLGNHPFLGLFVTTKNIATFGKNPGNSK